MSKQIVEILTRQQRLSIEKFGHHSTTEPIYTAICQELTELVNYYNDNERWAKCLMLSFGGALRCGVGVDVLANKLNIYDLRWQPIRWMDIQRELYEMQLHCRFDDWERWCNIARNLFILALSYKYSTQELLSAIDERLQQHSRKGQHLPTERVSSFSP